MKCILRVGYTDILLPDHKDVGKIADILSKGMMCERSYASSRDTVTITGELEVEFIMLKASTKIDCTKDMEEKAAEIKGLPNRQKALPFKRG